MKAKISKQASRVECNQNRTAGNNCFWWNEIMKRNFDGKDRGMTITLTREEYSSLNEIKSQSINFGKRDKMKIS